MKKFLSLVLALGLSISVLSAAVFAEDAPAEAQTEVQTEVQTEAPAEAPAEGSVPASPLEPSEMTSWPLHHVDVRIPGMVEVRRVDENGNVQSTEQVQVGVHAVSMKKNGQEMGPFYPKAGLPEQQKEFEWRNDELCLSVDDDLSITCKVFGTLADGTVFEREYTHTFTAEEKEAARLACPGCDTILAGLDFDIAMSFDEIIEPEQPDKPDPDPDKPNPDPDKPNPDPDKPNPDPDKPNPDPDKPNPDPDKPNPDPDKPNPDPDKPNPDPDKPNPDPDKPNPDQPEQPDKKPSSDKSEKKVEAAPAATAVPVKASPKTADTESLALYGAAAVLCAAALVVARRRANH